MRRVLGAGKAHDLEQKIIAEARALAVRLQGTSYRDQLPTGVLDSVVLVGTSYMDKTRKECIVLQNGELLQTSEFTNVRETQDALEIFKAVGFVMCDPDWAPLVAIAARSVLAEPDHLMPATLTAATADEPSVPVQIQERMLLDLRGLYRRSGVKRETLQQVVAAATDCGYFDDRPYLAERESPDRRDVLEIAEAFSAFDGEMSWQVRPETIAAFLNQFPPRHRDAMADALKQLVFFDNAALVSSSAETSLGAKHRGGRGRAHAEQRGGSDDGPSPGGEGERGDERAKTPHGAARSSS